MKSYSLYLCVKDLDAFLNDENEYNRVLNKLYQKVDFAVIGTRGGGLIRYAFNAGFAFRDLYRDVCDMYSNNEEMIEKIRFMEASLKDYIIMKAKRLGLYVPDAIEDFLKNFAKK